MYIYIYTGYTSTFNIIYTLNVWVTCKNPSRHCVLSPGSHQGSSPEKSTSQFHRQEAESQFTRKVPQFQPNSRWMDPNSASKFSPLWIFVAPRKNYQNCHDVKGLNGKNHKWHWNVGQTEVSVTKSLKFVYIICIQNVQESTVFSSWWATTLKYIYI